MWAESASFYKVLDIYLDQMFILLINYCYVHLFLFFQRPININITIIIKQNDYRKFEENTSKLIYNWKQVYFGEDNFRSEATCN